MSAIASPPTNISRLLRIAWAAGATVCAAAMYLLPGQETIPFHLIWLGLGLVYGFTDWRPVEMILMVGAATAVTAAILADHAAHGWIDWRQTAEVPLSVALTAVIAAYLRRRHQALAQLARMAETDRRRADTRQLLVRQVSHELRTPITIARGYTELLRTRLTDRQDLADTAIVLEELDKLAAITQRMLTLIQIEGDFERQPLALRDELIRIVHRWIPAADRRWNVSCPDGKVLASRDRLEAALDCLLDNAVKFTAPSDSITVTGGIDARSWSIEVADSGRGMSDVDAAALTAARPLFKNPSGGTGLGLAIVRTVISAWGGIVRFHARPGHGTTVVLRLPHTEAHDTPVIDVEPET